MGAMQRSPSFSSVLAVSSTNITAIAIIGAVIVIFGVIFLVIHRRRKAAQDAAYFASYEEVTPLASSERPDLAPINFASAGSALLEGTSETVVEIPEEVPESEAAMGPVSETALQPAALDDAAQALADLDRLLGNTPE